MTIRRAMILAAGFGTRLKPLSELEPKPLWPLLNRPLATWALEAAMMAGAREIVVNAHHLPERIAGWLHGEAGAVARRTARGEVTLAISLEEEILGTGGGVRHAEPFLAGGPFFLLNGDVFQRFDLDMLGRRHEQARAAATIVLTRARGMEHLEHVAADAEGAVVAIANQPIPAPDDAVRGIFSGVHVVDEGLMAHLPPDGKVACIVRHGYVPAIAAGERIRGVLDRSYWADLGTIGRYLQSHWELMDGSAGPLAPLIGIRYMEHEPGVWIGPGARVAKRAHLVPPVIVGDDAYVGEGVELGPYVVVGDEAVVEPGASLSRSVIWPRETWSGDGVGLVRGRGITVEVTE